MFCLETNRPPCPPVLKSSCAAYCTLPEDCASAEVARVPSTFHCTVTVADWDDALEKVTLSVIMPLPCPLSSDAGAVTFRPKNAARRVNGRRAEGLWTAVSGEEKLVARRAIGAIANRHSTILPRRDQAGTRGVLDVGFSHIDSGSINSDVSASGIDTGEAREQKQRTGQFCGRNKFFHIYPPHC